MPASSSPPSRRRPTWSTLGFALVLGLGTFGPAPAKAETKRSKSKTAKSRARARAKAKAREKAELEAKADSQDQVDAQAQVSAAPSEAPPKAKAKARGVKARKKAHRKPPVQAQRPAFLKRAELGALRTLSGARAIRFSRYTAPEWSFGGSVGLASFSHREPNDKGQFRRIRFVGRLMLGAEAMHWPMKLQDPKDRRLRADLGFGARFAFYWGFTGDDGDDDNTLDTPLELGLEFPIAVRLFVGSRIHVTPEFGLLLRYVPGSRKPDQNNDTDANPGSGVGERLGTTNGPGFGVEFGDHAGMFVGLSVGYLFGD